MTKSRKLSFSLLAMAFVLAIPAYGQKESLLIGPGDMVHVHVFETPDLDQGARVTDNGTLTLILGGDVHIADLTPAEAAKAIEDVLENGKFLLHPITIEEFATQKVTVLGEVKLPGAYTINTPRSVLEVLTLAGGLSDLADRKIIVQRRKTREQVTYFVSNQGDLALNSAIQVYPGDSLLVPRAGIVYMLGEVARPGGYTMTNNDAQLTVLQLLARAGGTGHAAVPSHARLIRRKGDEYVEQELQLSNIQKGKQADFVLQADDVIWVPFSYVRNVATQSAAILSTAGSAAIYRF